MVEHQTDRMVMVGFAVLMFGILAIIFRKGIKEIMESIVGKVQTLISKATEQAGDAGSLSDGDVDVSPKPLKPQGQ